MATKKASMDYRPNVFDPKVVRDLAWLMAAAEHDDQRPLLTMVQFGAKCAAACDGMRLHLSRPPAEILPGLCKVTIDGHTAQVAGQGPEAGTYPDIARLWPKGKPIATVTLNRKYLLDALKGVDDEYVELAVYDRVQPVAFRMANHAGLIMPAPPNGAMFDPFADLVAEAQAKAEVEKAASAPGVAGYDVDRAYVAQTQRAEPERER